MNEPSNEDVEGKGLRYTLADEDYLELWQYFQGRADTLKDSMFQTVTWVIGFAVALLGFCYGKFIEFENGEMVILGRWLGVGCCLVGLVLCGYAWILLREYGKHIQRNWDRADRCKAEIGGLERLIFGKKLLGRDGKRTESTLKLRNIWDQILVFVGLLALVLVGTAFLFAFS